MNRIALIFAMEAEGKPLIDRLGLKRDLNFGDPKLPFEHYLGRFGANTELLVSLGGKDKVYGVDNIGTEPATLNAYITLSHFKPDLLINPGTAGAFQKKGAKIGDVYLASEAFRFHDRRIPIALFDAYGIGHYPVFSIPEMAAALGLKEGVVTTANSLDYTEMDMTMMVQNNGSVKEMEAAAIGWVAHLLGIPFMALKSVTDFVDCPHSAQEQFLKNLGIATHNLCNKTVEVLEYLAGIQRAKADTLK